MHGDSRFGDERALLAFDRTHIWHPYSAIANQPPLHAVRRAHGVRLELYDGREVIDAMGSWWSVIHGYNHPRLNAALHAQIDDMAHVMFGGLTHRAAATLASHLIDLTPAPLDKVFFADSGSVAVEVALKMAVQYWHARGLGHKQRMLTVRGGYHGDTFGAMSVCDPVTGMHGLFRGALAEQLFAPRPVPGFHEPWDDTAIDGLAQLFRDHHHEIAAMILEPVVQGAGGMWFYHPEYLRRARALCDDYDVLLVFDEIATGFGRTGKLFALEHAGVVPDLLCLGKALTGGYMTLAATLTTDAVAQSICAGEPGVFMHGPTFMANPLACAVASASIELLLETDWQRRVTRIETQLGDGLGVCRDYSAVRDVRVLGAIGVVELQQPIDMHRAPARFVDAGVWVRPFGRLVYVMPPYTIGADDLDLVCQAIRSVVKDPPVVATGRGNTDSTS